MKKNLLKWVVAIIGLLLVISFLIFISPTNIQDTLHYFEPCNPHIAYATQTDCVCPTDKIVPFGYSLGIWTEESDGWHCYYVLGGKR